MNAYIVTYDLHAQGQNYQCLKETLQGYPGWFHMQGSVWIVCSDRSAINIRDKLSACLDRNDKLFVAKLDGDAAWNGYDAANSEWLKKHL